MQRLFHRRIAQPEPLLQEVDAKHRRNAHRRATRLSLRVVRLDQRDQLGPRHDALHLVEELALARSLGRQLQPEIGLLHRFMHFKSVSESSHRFGAVRSSYADLP
jgi:hypothetical protein